MKLKLSSKSLAKRALLYSFQCALILLSGCTYSTSPTYTQEKIASAITDICKNEYKLDVLVTVVGSSLWIYLPVEDIFVKSDKPQKTTELFKIEENRLGFENNYLKSAYAIKKVPPKVQLDDSKINKDVTEKLVNAWKALRRIVFSMKEAETNKIKFFCIVIADIKNGREIVTINYYLDLKKVCYNLISTEEYQHRTIQDTIINPVIIGDKDGKHLKYSDISMDGFVASQIQYRIGLKFQKPEIEKQSVDIDKEILKIFAYTINIYGFKDFNGVELNNIVTGKKLILNKAAVLAQPNEKRF